MGVAYSSVLAWTHSAAPRDVMTHNVVDMSTENAKRFVKHNVFIDEFDEPAY